MSHLPAGPQPAVRACAPSRGVSPDVRGAARHRGNVQLSRILGLALKKLRLSAFWSEAHQIRLQLQFCSLGPPERTKGRWGGKERHVFLSCFEMKRVLNLSQKPKCEFSALSQTGPSASTPHLQTSLCLFPLFPSSLLSPNLRSPVPLFSLSCLRTASRHPAVRTFPPPVLLS